jgi:hypothetical protein
VQVRIPPAECFQVLSALQLAMRHPDLPESIRLTVMRVAGCLQEHIAVTDNLAGDLRGGLGPVVRCGRKGGGHCPLKGKRPARQSRPKSAPLSTMNCRDCNKISQIGKVY